MAEPGLGFNVPVFLEPASQPMHNLSGTGRVLIGDHQLEVTYDLVQSQPDGPVEGQLFGDPAVISEAYQAHAVTLLLEDGGRIKLRLLSCETHGAADVRAVGPLPGTEEAA